MLKNQKFILFYLNWFKAVILLILTRLGSNQIKII